MHLPTPLPDLQGSLPLGVYVHVPFCASRCAYCSFTSTCDLSGKSKVLAKLQADVLEAGQALAHPPVDTLYLGGGTPSILDLEELASLTQALKQGFDLQPLREATLEANPGSLVPHWLQGARRLGWDRISIGIQTLDDTLLQRLGRPHSAAEGLEAIRQARDAGFTRISCDLMIGIPGQDLARVRSDAAAMVGVGAQHLSIYMLDLDKACPLKTLVDEGRLALPCEDAVADAFEALQEWLPDLGLRAYEISNHAIPGEEAIHNVRYWERRPYLGFGPSAASHLEPWRWTQPEDLRAWQEGQPPEDMGALSPLECLAEIPLLGLRMLQGIDWKAFQTSVLEAGFQKELAEWEHALKPFLDQGLLMRDGDHLKFTRKGLLLSNQVLGIFV